MKFQMKRFPFIKYNLSENNVHGAEIVSLEYLSKTILIGKQFAQKSIVIKKINLQYCKEEKYAPYPREWYAMEETVTEKTRSLLPEVMKTDVRPMVSLIGKDIFELLSKSVANFGDHSLFLDNLVFNSQGLINSRGTIQTIINKSNFPWMKKLEIACKYFIGKDEINHILEELPWEILKFHLQYKDNYNDISCDDACIAIYFWFWYIGTEKDRLGRIKKFLKIKAIGSQFTFDERQNNSAIRNLYWWALKNGNETAVQFIYDNFIMNNPQKDSILFEHINYFGFRYNSTNIILYIISHINEGKLPEWFRILVLGILREMMRQTRWHNTFLLLFKNLGRNCFEYVHYVVLLKGIVKVAFDIALIGNNTKPYEDLIREYLGNVPHTIIVHLVLQDNGFYTSILEIAFSLRNWNLTCLLLEISRKYLITKQLMLKQMLFTTDISLFHMAICKADVKFIDKVLDYYLEKKENRLSIKRWIFYLFAYKACDFYIVTGNENRLHCFIKWASDFCAEETIEVFKSNIPFESDKKTIKKILFDHEEENYENTFLNYLKNVYFETRNVKLLSSMRNVCPFEYTEKILLWCFPYPEDVSNYKSLICKEDSDQPDQFFYTNIKRWIKISKVCKVMKLIDWCPIQDDDVKTLKIKLLNDSDISSLYSKDENLRHFFQGIEEINL